MILDLLGEGKQRALSAEYLSKITGDDKRTLRAKISKERQDGAIIAGTAAGYYIPNNREELERHINSMMKRGITAFKSIKAARQKLKEMGADNAENG